MNRKRGIALAFVLVAAVVITAATQGRFSDEPRFEGRPLSVWVGIAADSQANSEEHFRASAVIRKAGTNAVPWLLKMLREATPPNPNPPPRIDQFLWQLGYRPANPYNLAAAGLVLLDADGFKPALEPLMQMTDDPRPYVKLNAQTILLNARFKFDGATQRRILVKCMSYNPPLIGMMLTNKVYTPQP